MTTEKEGRKDAYNLHRATEKEEIFTLQGVILVGEKENRTT